MTGSNPWTAMWSGGFGAMQSSLRFAEMIAASGEVIESRSRSIADAMRDPLHGDYRELGRMVPEKVEAFSRAGSSVFSDVAAIQADAVASWFAAASMMLGGRLPTEGETSEMMSRSGRMVARSMAIGDKAMAPLHRGATANARRLRKR